MKVHYKIEVILHRKVTVAIKKYTLKYKYTLKFAKLLQNKYFNQM